MSEGPDATLLARREVSAATAFFDLELDRPLIPPSESAPAFVPGQYVTVAVPLEGGGWVKRPLTLTSTPARPDRIELLVNRVRAPASDAPLSHRLFDLPEGARLSIRPAATGRFTLPDTVGDRGSVLMVGVETGIAPFLSMVRTRAEVDAPLEGLAVVHAVSDPVELAARAELEGLTARGLRYWPYVIAEQWPIEALADRLPAWLGAPLEPAALPVLACGLGAPLAALTYALLPRGYAPRHRRLRKALDIPLDAPAALHLEQYDAARMFDTKDAETMAALKAGWPG